MFKRETDTMIQLKNKVRTSLRMARILTGMGPLISIVNFKRYSLSIVYILYKIKEPLVMEALLTQEPDDLEYKFKHVTQELVNSGHITAIQRSRLIYNRRNYLNNNTSRFFYGELIALDKKALELLNLNKDNSEKIY